MSIPDIVVFYRMIRIYFHVKVLLVFLFEVNARLDSIF